MIQETVGAMLSSWLPGKQTLTFAHSEKPLVLETKAGRQRAFPDICKENIPECNLNPFLFNGHLQTMWTAVTNGGPPIHYKRRVFSAEDPAFRGHFAVDFVTSPSAKAGLKEDPVGVGHIELPERTTYFTDEEFKGLGSDDTKPLLIALHGLSGGSHEVYLRHVLAPLVAKTSEGHKAGLSGGDWEALVVNSRGCAGSKITSTILYNARATWDTRQIVGWCRKIWPNRPLFAIGFSLGANILTNLIAEEGSGCQLRAGLIISSPWNLEVSSNSLKRTYLGLEVYSKTMGGNMRRVFEAHREEILKNTNIKLEGIHKVKYLHEFDREVQCATWGYPTEGAYYRDASSVDALFNVRIPLLCIGSQDDPIACNESVPYDEAKLNPYVVICATSHGGHIGWFEWGGGRWHTRPAYKFLNAMWKEIDYSKTVPPKGFNGNISYAGNPHEEPFVFKPLRRKLHLQETDQYQPNCL